MNNKAYNLMSYAFAAGEDVLIDANVWLYLFPAPNKPSYRYANHYSSGFFRMINAGAKPIMDPMVLSEYLNRYSRLEWEGNYIKQYPKFKDFRMSSDFQLVSKAAHTFASKILSFCEVHSVNVKKQDLSNALIQFQSGSLDFNDAILVGVCKEKNIKLMTNDADFKFGGIEILTTNPKLLQACL